MSYFNPAQVYGQLKNENAIENEDKRRSHRQIQVQECGEATLVPDRIKCTISVSNIKVGIDFVDCFMGPTNLTRALYFFVGSFFT